MTSITHKATAKSVLDLIYMYESGRLNLEPGFQRQSVWNARDRAKLIESILRNYPLPAIFLYKRNDEGDLVFDVIDGKQRLESIFMFVGKMRGQFDIKFQNENEDGLEVINWKTLQRRKQQSRLVAYEIPIIEVDGEFGEIVDVFIKINSTGKALTPQEKRKALYYNTAFLKAASKLANKYKKAFVDNKIFTAGHITRMKHVELISELMLSLLQGDVLNKKTVLDKVMQANSFDNRQLGKASRLATSAFNRTLKMFPNLRTSRFRQITDFYSLVVLVGKFEQERLILTDKKRNRIAWGLLQAFGTRVDELRQLQRKLQGARPGQDTYREYLLTVSQMTDDVNQRRKREQILRSLLSSIFAEKDAQRGFSAEQRRIIWNSTANKMCSHTGCAKKLTWSDFTIDHINPHSKGGRSALNNAAIMCREHNSAKGNKSRSSKH